VEALGGDKAKAQTVLEELTALANQRYIPPSNLALAYYAVGNKDAALSQLDRACEERDVRVTLLKVDPRWDSLRSDPRFVAILKRIGLE
jgi:Flp pilus assembly protein TadD